ncbi:MAG: PAS domain S-box-containing protein [Granulosicoccus sp.]|jgi:PAS domain S-box-containing protein
MSNKINQEWGNEWAEIALANSVFPVLWLSPEARIIRFNKALATTLNYDSDTLKSLTLFDLDEQLTKKNWKVNWAQLSKQKSLLMEAELNNSKGQLIPVELNYTLIEVGTFNLCCILIRDISKTKKAFSKLEEANRLLDRTVKERSENSEITTQALKTQQAVFKRIEKIEKQNQLILNSAGEGIYGLDNQGHTTFVNEAAAKMVGWELGDLVGKNQHDILHHTKPDGTAYEVKGCPIYAAFKDGKIHTVDDEVFWRKDGTSFPVEYTSTPIKDADGKLLGAVVVFKDITKRKEAEQVLQKTNINLQNALSEVEQLKIRLEAENKYLQQELKLTHNFEEIISDSKVFRKVLAKVEQVAGTDATVLITGESGTGKELIARAVHNLSSRKDRALVKLNCAALAANLIESELFGHERGAFTGALNQRVGRFELADGGTIFLDEIGELPIDLQSKLLRVLQEGEFERLGSARTIKVDVRIIAATNRDLPEEIGKGNFREDLYYRLNVFPIHAPPLRERRDDIPLLVNHFLSKFEIRLGKKIGVVSKKVMNDLVSYPWAGNVRELENVIERAAIISQGDKLELGDALSKTSGTAKNKRITTLDENERQHILKALQFTNWKVSGEKGAAKLLDLNRTTLEARMKKLDIRRP